MIIGNEIEDMVGYRINQYQNSVILQKDIHFTLLNIPILDESIGAMSR